MPKLDFLKCLKNKKTVLLLFIVTFVSCFLIAQNAHAFLGGILAYFTASSDALEDTFLQITRTMFGTAIAYGVGYATMLVSSMGIDYILNNPEMLSLKGDVMVLAGWDFTSGLANLILVVLFVVVALSFILKSEKLQPKKSLINLILVAIFINFSFLLCQIFVDVSNIIMTSLSSVIEGGLAGGFVEESLMVAGDQVGAIFGFLIVAFTTAALSVVGYPLFQVGGLMAVNTFFIGHMMNFFMQLAVILALGGVLLLYFLVLIARIVVIKILVILSPLAFLAFILPQTQSMAKNWLNNLAHWSFFIVPLTFFLLMGNYLLQAMPAINIALPETISILGFDVTSNFAYFFKYVLLLVFLAVALKISDKVVPKDLTEMVGKVKGLVPIQMKQHYRQIGGAMKEGGAYLGKNAVNRFMEGGINETERIEEFQRMAEGTDQNWETLYEQSEGRAPNNWARGGIRQTLDSKLKGRLSGKGLDAENMGAKDFENVIKGGLSNMSYTDNDVTEIMSKMKSSELQKVFEGGDLSGQEIDKLIKYSEKLSYPQKERVARNAIGARKKDEQGNLIDDAQVANMTCTKLLGPMQSIENLVEKTSESQVADISANALKQEKVLKKVFASWDGRNFAEAAKDKDKFEGLNKNIPLHYNIIESKNLRAKKYFTSQTSLYNYPESEKEVEGARQMHPDQTTLSDFGGGKKTSEAGAKRSGKQSSPRSGTGKNGEAANGRNKPPKNN